MHLISIVLFKRDLKPATRIQLQPSHTKTPTHIEPRTIRCNSTEKLQAPDDGVINVRNMLST